MEERQSLISLAHENLKKDAESLSTQTREFVGFASGTAAGVVGTTGLIIASGRRAYVPRLLQPRSGNNLISPRTPSPPPVRCFVDIHRDRIPTYGDLPASAVKIIGRY